MKISIGNKLKSLVIFNTSILFYVIFLLTFLDNGSFYINVISEGGRSVFVLPNYKFVLSVLTLFITSIILFKKTKQKYWLVQTIFIVSSTLFWKSNLIQSTILINSPTSIYTSINEPVQFIDNNRDDIRDIVHFIENNIGDTIERNDGYERLFVTKQMIFKAVFEGYKDTNYIEHIHAKPKKIHSSRKLMDTICYFNFPDSITNKFGDFHIEDLYFKSDKIEICLINYYHEKYGVDVRSIRYPGIISWKTKPGGGTTDYAVDIYFKAVEEQKYECFLSEDTCLPMMYMQDAINATIQIMQADASKIKTRTSYNLAGMSFTPKDVAVAIQKHIPEFKITYKTDFRQEIASSWPQIIDDSDARTDWNWKHKFDLDLMTSDMLENLK